MTANFKQHIADIERSSIERALKNSNGNATKAAKALGIKRTTMVMKRKKYGFPLGRGAKT